MKTGRMLSFVGHEVREMIPPTLFFLVGFNLIVLTSYLLLEDYGLRLFNFLLATTSALVVGKAVLLANALPSFGAPGSPPLAARILIRTLVYVLVVMLVRMAEHLVEFWIDGGAIGDSLRHLREEFAWHRFAAVQIWICVLFLIYTTADELMAALGPGEFSRLLFRRAPAPSGVARREPAGSRPGAPPAAARAEAGNREIT